MRRQSLVALLVTGWMACLVPFAQGCKNDEPAPAESAAPELREGDLIRGLLGSRSVAEIEDRSASKSYDGVADAIVAEIDATSPGRVAHLEAELRSGDPARMVAAKKAIDQAIADAAANPKLGTGSASLLGQSLRPLDQQGLVQPGMMPITGDASQLLCEQPKGPDGKPIHLGAVNGTYGDDRSGVLGAARDTTDLVDTTDLNLFNTLRRVDNGQLTPAPDSRLGAYAATRGYPVGTVGNSVHNAIGTIYITFANYGQENIGRVFNSPQAMMLYNQPVSSCAGYQMAALEYQYWSDVRTEDPVSPGGNLGSAFNPDARNWLQQSMLFNR